jgi:DNA-binding LacI/PurR family transcriptional regulator
MNIREIAKRAKVSTATVSRTINNVPTVAAPLAKRVWKVVEELGYCPNTQARALVSGRSRIFGLVISEITNPFFPEIVQTFENLAVKHNYEILLTSTIHDPKRMEISVRRMVERRVDGVAVMTFGLEEVLSQDRRFRDLPLVFVDTKAEGATTIRVNYENGIRQAVQHLAALSHKHIAFISGPLHLRSALARKNAFKLCMGEIDRQVSPELMVEGDHTMDGGRRAYRKLHELREPPTAVLCSNDMTAIGVMREAYEHGVSVPQQLSVIGFDDIRMAQFMVPPLTTIQMSQARLAELAFKALLTKTEPNHADEEYELQTSLVLRASTARPGSVRKKLSTKKSED